MFRLTFGHILLHGFTYVLLSYCSLRLVEKLSFGSADRLITHKIADHGKPQNPWLIWLFEFL